MRRLRFALGPLFALSVVVTACGGGKDAPPAQGSAPAAAPAGGLTAFEQENGIGPVKQAVDLGPIDGKKVEEGKTLFEGKCVLCHKLTERYVGPALGGVTERRTAAYVMNMILNPEEMYTRHPVARQLLAEHMTQMPNLGLTQDQAREIVEYLRTQTSTPAGT
jgi:mono/diheme cytochrome c family protein